MKNNLKGKLEKSNFKLIEKEFSDLILTVAEIDQTGMGSRPNVTRKTYTFKDNTFLSITERYISGGIIDYYNYDLYNSNEEIIIKFHSEPHQNKKQQTKTEPYHIHKHNTLGVEDRLPNYVYKRLTEIFEYIKSRID
ncbi:toxin-antitoxin system TumE family protein [Clostridium estertheticum]|uniref:Uncharacterized protein n=1 Tax=Clostridium estertheticum subsp. estertheticum TaxID=1552 RepID=A0A1J0GD44_9CLOT|nr:DUF6516 family protein [Clostridium estertheticum]APC39276.1 hypothetical protein A7L45_03970 [Clostridium estertheticum subsp. estertheticum]MBZ9614721.1 DUF6516 family protein [Clostridium estertheticum subsp. laramiense]WAG74643.1 DUF6516 family protein [Clostridium estertheticum]